MSVILDTTRYWRTGMPRRPKQYLGDGVYVDYDGLHIVLTAEDGGQTIHTIYLDPEVWAALENYVRGAPTLADSQPYSMLEDLKRRMAEPPVGLPRPRKSPPEGEPDSR